MLVFTTTSTTTTTIVNLLLYHPFLFYIRSLHSSCQYYREIYNLPVNLFNFPVVKQEKRCINPPPLRAGDRVG